MLSIRPAPALQDLSTTLSSEPQITAASAQPVYGIIHTSDIEGADISGRTVGSTSRSRAVSNTSLGKRYRSGCTASSLEIDHPQFASDEAFQESGEDGPNKRRKTECCCSPSSSVPHSWARRQWRCSTKTFRLRSLPVLENLASQIIDTCIKSAVCVGDSEPSLVSVDSNYDASQSCVDPLISLFEKIRSHYDAIPDHQPYLCSRALPGNPTDQVRSHAYRRANLATFILQLSSEGAEEVCLPDSEFLSTILSNGSTFTGPSGKLYLDYKTQLFLRKASNAAAGSFPSKSVREEALEELFPEDMAFRLLSQLNDGRGTADQGSDTGEMNTWLATTALGRKSYLRRACSDDEKGNSELLQMIESQTWTLFTHQMLDWLSGIDPPEAIDHPGQLAPVPSESSLDKMSICGDGDPKNTDLTSHVTTILSLDTDSEIEQAIARATREIEATYNLETHPGFGGNGLPNFGPESRLKLNHAKGLTLNQPTRSSGHPRSFSNTDVLPPSLAAQALSATHPSASQAAYTAARDLIAKRQAEALAAQLAAQQAQHETLLSTLGAGSPIPAGLINTQQFPITLPAQRRPWNIEEEQTLLKGLDLVGGPHWSKILNLFGQTGSVNEVLAGRTQVQLKDKARNLKLWFLKEGLSVPEGLSGVTGDLETRGRGNMTRNAKAGLKGPKKEEEVQGEGEGEGEGEGGKEVEGANGVQE